MNTLTELLKHFFTHKDFLPPAEQIAGTMFTPLHIIVSVIVFALMLWMVRVVSRCDEKTRRRVFAVLWLTSFLLEAVKVLWETFGGASVRFELGGNLPLYPCSVFMYAMPFAIWGKGSVRYAACGYVCTVGMVGGLVNFVYPATIMGDYSVLSFPGLNTLYNHGVIVFCALVMLFSGYHSYTKATKWWHLLLPSAPLVAVSLVANAVNFSPIGSDYMFFRLRSFIFAPLGEALPLWAAPLLVYAVYLLLHALPYLPFYFRNRKQVAYKMNQSAREK